MPLCLIIFSVNGCFLKYLIEILRSWMAPHEFEFANGFCGKVERAVGGVDIHIEEIIEVIFGEKLIFIKRKGMFRDMWASSYKIVK